MVEARLIVADYSSSGSSDVPNPCVIGSAHLYLGSIFVMSEGRRGIHSGRVESRLAVSEVLTRFRSGETSDPRQRLQDALCHASSVLLSRSRAATVFSNSSATCSAVLIRGDRLYAARAGNLALQLIRKNRAIVLFDHRTGALGDSSGLGTSDNVYPEVLPDPVPLQPGDRIILANDLLMNTVSEEECLRIVAELVPAVATRRLVEAVMRSGEQRPVSVQVVEIEAFADGRDEVIPPMPASRAVAAGPEYSTASNSKLKTPIPTRSGRGGRWVPRLILLLLALLVAGMAARVVKPEWFESTESTENLVKKSEKPDTLSGSENSEGPVRGTDQPVPAQSFWQAVSKHDVDGVLQLDKDTLRDLIADVSELDRRIQEAQTLAKNLTELVAEENGTDGRAKPPKRDGGVGAGAPPSKAVRNWDPEKLPKNLRQFEQMFSQDDPKEAAARLRRYIGARHKYATRVFKILDAYIERAPKARSLTVLEHLGKVRPAPGPRTKRWARKVRRKLRNQLKENASDRAPVGESLDTP